MPRTRPPDVLSRLPLLVAILLPLIAPPAALAGARFDVLETRDLRLLYHKPTLGFIAPYTAQCFETSLNFYRQTLQYTPTEKVNVFLDDWADFMNAGVWGSPRSSMTMHVAPADFVYETDTGNERISFTMNHEVAHVVTLDQQTPMDGAWRGFFQGKVRETDDDPETILYGFMTLPRRAAPRWHREGTAVFFETWMSGGFGRAQGPYDEMVFRAMVRDSAYFYDPVGLESEGTKADFQVGVNSYLYGTRFMTYMAWRDSPGKLVEWVSRRPGSKGYFGSQFKHVYGEPLNAAWQDWIRFEHDFQRANLDSIARFPTTPYRDLSPHPLGSLSRAYLNVRDRTLYAGINYPGTVAHLGAIPLDGGAIRKLRDVKGPMLYSVCSLGYDPEGNRLFYTTDNNDWRDLMVLDPATREVKRLMKDARVGDLAFDRADRSLWGIRNFNGISSLVRMKAPYTDYTRVTSFPYSHDLYDIDISPDGKWLCGSMASVNGHQTLRLFSVDSLLNGIDASRQLYDFGTAIPENFVFSADGRSLWGSSYYTGVSNIFRYDLAADSMDIVTNAATGFFRPLPLGGDSVLVFRYTGKGFVPSLIHVKPLSDVSAITFLGNDLVTKYPVLKNWRVPSQSLIPLDSLTRYSGTYGPWGRIGLNSMYPIVEGYKDWTALGLKLLFSDPFSFQNFDVAGLYTATGHVPDRERWHALANYHHFAWSADFEYNGTSFYDLVGPIKVSRKGYQGGVTWSKTLIRDTPRTLDLGLDVHGFADIERLPFHQNISTLAGYNRGFTPELDLHYKYFRSSLGWVDPEKGVEWRLTTNVNSLRVEQPTGTVWRGFPQTSGTLDLGYPMPVPHSSLWLRTAAGYSPGDREQPFSNFYFGAFGNNYLDYQEPKRYRNLYSFPGIDIDNVGGTNFGKAMLDLNLPPWRFRRAGWLDFYATWARFSLFSTGLVTNVDLPSHRALINAGAQMDVRLSLMIQQPMTLSLGYASAFERLQATHNEFIISLKILG
jgi:hypothetical protein